MSSKWSHKHPIEGTGFLFWRLANIWKKHINEGLSELGITHVQYLLLATLDILELDDKLTTQKAVANYAKVDIMMTSKVLRSLEKSKLIQRKAFHLDQRAKQCKLTAQGKALLAEATPIVKRLDEQFFESVTRNKFSLQSIFAQTIEEFYTS